MEPLFKHILAPVDLGTSSIPALRYTVAFAKRFESDVTLMYADELASMFADYGPWVASRDQSDAEERRIKEALLGFAAEHAPEIGRPGTIIVPDHPVKAIVRAAMSVRADLIIMGTHGRHGWRRALAGSVADGVLRAAGRPVLVVPEHQVQRKPDEIARVICPVNFTEAAHDAVTCAAGLAAAFDAELILVHVAESEPAAPDAEAIHEYFEQWVSDDVRARSSFRELVLRGGAAERVLDCVEDLDADMLVMGAQLKWLRNESVIGTTSERLLRFSPVPVLTVTRAAVEAPREDAVIEEARYD